MSSIKGSIQKTHDAGAESAARLAEFCASVHQMAVRLGIVKPEEVAGTSDLLTMIEKTLMIYKIMPIDFSVHKFTPKDAIDLLGGEQRDKNKDNRALSDRIVTRYGNDMTAGRWRTTHQAIAVGPDGRMVDGQHRLEAIIKTGVAVEMVLAIYRDEKMAELARQCVDTGRARRCGDALEIAGVVKRGLGKRVSSILAALAALPNRAFGAPLAASFAYAFPVAAEQTRTFARLVIDKVGIEADSAAFHFVRLFDGKHTSKSQKERVEVTHRALRCIQMHILGERMSKFQVSEKGLDYFRNKRLTLGLPT